MQGSMNRVQIMDYWVCNYFPVMLQGDTQLRIAPYQVYCGWDRKLTWAVGICFSFQLQLDSNGLSAVEHYHLNRVKLLTHRYNFIKILLQMLYYFFNYLQTGFIWPSVVSIVLSCANSITIWCTKFWFSY